MTNNQIQLFKKLHKNQKPLILTNIWDAAGARLLSEYQATAIATSSAALAWSLGYADGYQLPKQVMLAAVQRIRNATHLPVTVDIENGYSQSPEDVSQLVVALREMGITGINIEDGTEAPEKLAEKIAAIKTRCPDVFINARCDVILRQLYSPTEAYQEIVARSEMYKASGADGLFFPGLLDCQFANQLHQNLHLPINLMASTASEVQDFRLAGIRRISMGPAGFIAAYQALVNCQLSHQNQSDSTINALNFAAINALFA